MGRVGTAHCMGGVCGVASVRRLLQFARVRAPAELTRREGCPRLSMLHALARACVASTPRASTGVPYRDQMEYQMPVEEVVDTCMASETPTAVSGAAAIAFKPARVSCRLGRFACQAPPHAAVLWPPLHRFHAQSLTRCLWAAGTAAVRCCPPRVWRFDHRARSPAESPRLRGATKTWDEPPQACETRRRLT